MDLLTEKYIYLLSNRLPKFTVKHKHPLTVNFRCVVCGDSKKNKSKTRGYIIEKKGKYFYYCHNCNVSHKFETFLKRFDFSLYEQFNREKIGEKFEKKKEPSFTTKISEKDFSVNDYTKDKRFAPLRTIDQLPKTHVARNFIERRNIPKDKIKELYYCPAFKQWTNLWIPNKFDLVKGDDYKAIVIPILNIKKKLVGFQGRVLGHKDIRYISISLTDFGTMIYNINNIDFNKRIYVFEGPFDSMFLPNAIAVCGGAIEKQLQRVVGWKKENSVIVYDNEARSKQAIKNIENALTANYSVCIWPSSESLKDVNDMVNNYIKCGMSLKEASVTIKRTIDKNTFAGLTGLLQLKEWKKVA